MKSILCLLASLLACSLAAQSPTYRFGAPYPAVAANSKRYVAVPDQQLLISIKEKYRRFSSTNKLYLQSYDLETLEEIHHTETEFPSNTAFVLKPFLFHGKVYMLYQDDTKSRADRRVFVQELDPQTAQFKGKPIRLVGNEDLGRISVQNSVDGQQLIIRGQKMLERKKDNIQLGFYVFGKDFKQLSSTTVELPYSYQRATIRDYHVGLDGTPYLLVKVYPEETRQKKEAVRLQEDGSRQKKERINYRLELLKINPADGSYTTNNINLDGLWPVDYLLVAGPNGEVVCGGYYTRPTSQSQGVDGVFIIRMDADGQYLSSIYHEIPLEVLAQYEAGGTQRRQAKRDLKGEAEMYGLEMDRLSFRSDGSIVINGEVYFSRLYHTTTNGQTISYRIYYYQDILSTKINPDGTLAWMNKVPKSQSGRRPHGNMGYRYFYQSGRHYYLYLDHEDNEKMGKFDTPKLYRDGRGGALMASVIDDATGEVYKKAVVHTLRNDSKYKLYQFSTAGVTPIGDGKAVVEFFIKRGSDVLMELQLPE